MAGARKIKAMYSLSVRVWFRCLLASQLRKNWLHWTIQYPTTPGQTRLGRKRVASGSPNYGVSRASNDVRTGR